MFINALCYSMTLLAYWSWQTGGLDQEEDMKLVGVREEDQRTQMIFCKDP